MARRRKGRALDGVLLLDKPKGLSANQALQRTRRLFQAAKAGHTGTLDPMATGLLPVCFGEATKFSAYLLDADKRYQARVQLGVATDSGDADGQEISSAEVPALDKNAIERVLETFRGQIEQVPPMYSALKHQGRPLYELARQGIEVKRTPRRVTLHDITLLAWEPGSQSLVLDVTCSKGTYIRTLAIDIGAAIGCGAHLTMLRRLQTGPFNGDRDGMLGLGALEEAADELARDAHLLPVDVLLRHLPQVQVNEVAAARLRLGQKVHAETAMHPEETVLRAYEGDRLLGLVAVIKRGVIAPRRLLSSVL